MCLSIRMKIGLAFSAVLVCTVALGEVAIARLDAVDAADVELRARGLPGAKNLSDIAFFAMRFRQLEASHALEPNIEAKAGETVLLQSVAGDVAGAIMAQKRLVDPDSDGGRFARIERAWQDYLGEDAQFCALSNGGDVAGAAALYHGRMRVTFGVFRYALEDETAHFGGMTHAAVGRGAALRASGRALILSLVAAAAVLSAWIGLSLVGLVSAPITAMTRAMSRLAGRDLDVEIPYVGRGDEIGAMASAMQVFKENAARNRVLEAAERRAQEERALAAEAGRQMAEQVALERSTQLRIASANLPLQEFLELVVKEMVALTGVDGVAVELVQGHELVLSASAGRLQKAAGLRLPLEAGLSGEAVRLKRTVVTHDAQSDSGARQEPAPRPQRVSMLAAPLVDGDRVLGVIKLGSSRASAFTQADADSLAVFADLVSCAIGRERAREAAANANRAKSEFLANMSHEIRTPLNGIVATADVLANAGLHPREQEMVDIIRGSAGALAGLLSDILDQARIEAGQLHIEAVPFHLGDLIRGVAGLWRMRADEKGVLLTLEIDPSLDGRFVGDELRIRQILTNFVSNAIKFTMEGAVMITASRTTDGLVRLSVADTGVGFDEDQASRIFNRFEQADGSIVRRFGGAGLGLAICQQLSRLMHGRIDCRSAPGQGSLFWVDLPLDAADLAAPEAQVEPAAAMPDQRLHILIVDDHPTNRKVAELMLDQLEATYQSVADGAAAVEAFCDRRFDLILMDMQMPVMDGLKATRAIRDLERARGARRTPIVMLTANAQPEHVQAAVAAGADGHLGKPITTAALYQALASALAEPEAAPEVERPCLA